MRNIVICGLMLMLAAGAANAAIIYSQPYNPGSHSVYSSVWTNETGPFHQCFTDYYWDGSAMQITDFHWWGGDNYGGQSVDGFTFQIWSNSGMNMPLDLLYEEFITGNAGATYLEHNCGIDVCKYSFMLANPFTPEAPGYYWFSIAGHNGGDNWFWAMADGIDFNADWQHAFIPTDAPYWENPIVRDDFAFELTGAVIPEPATLTLLGLGLFGLALRRRK